MSVVFEVEFSQPVTGFTASDVVLSGTALPTTAEVVGSGANYTVTVTGMTVDGTVIASIPAGVAQNIFGDGNLASTSYDNEADWVKPYQLDAAILALNPLTYLPLLETSGSVATDASGNARNGTYDSHTLANRAGLDGRMYPHFNAAGGPSGVTVPAEACWRPVNSGAGLSAMVMVYFVSSPDLSGGNQAIGLMGSCNSMAAREWEWWFYGATGSEPEKIAAMTHISNGNTARYSMGPDSNLTGVWKCFIVTWANDNSFPTHYYNWVVQTPFQTSGSSAAGGLTYPLRIGHLHPTGGSPDVNNRARLVGSFAHVAVFPFVLSSLQRAALQAAAEADGWAWPPPPFDSTGAFQNFTVPAGVTTLTVDAYGAQGSWDSSGVAGGNGGRVKCNVAVTPGEVLRIYIGQQAAQVAAAGFGGGGDRGTGGSLLAGSGGGATDIRRAPYGLADRLVVAPGGGGRGANNGAAGGIGGTPVGTVGGNSWGGASTGGGPGTASAGGAAGTGGTPTAGALGQGGAGANTSRTGAGGGGGLYGGGGGGGDSSAGSGGGGGSGKSTGVAETIQDGVRTGHGTMTLSW